MAHSSHPTPLHTLFSLKDARGFRQLLDARSSNSSSAPGTSSSGPRSWVGMERVSGGEVNVRDGFGRTVLHLACGSTEPWALEYVRVCLAQQGVNVNLLDGESGWTALHRALYVGNLQAARLLLERADTDLKLKDHDDFTPFDVYNSTIAGTAPPFEDTQGGTHLYTWGVNRNFTLGLGDGDDRTHPEPVNLSKLAPPPPTLTGSARFTPIRVLALSMSKLHTGILTSEPRSNLRLCGFGSGGRLGAAQHTAYHFASVRDLPGNVGLTALALAQDHTLVLTSQGEVYSWGLGRFGQLGYAIEPGTTGGQEKGDGEQVQYAPKKVVGPLKGKWVLGVACCKTASAAWTQDGLYTWGTNAGQLGFPKGNQSVQPLPRKVTALAQGVVDVALSENAMCCLLDSADVLCFWNETHFKVNFPAQKFRNESSIYRPPQTSVRVMIRKVVSCDNTFAALSTFGDVFFFSLPLPGELDGDDRLGNGEKFVLRPQRIWDSRSAESVVKDIGLGGDGTVILCTATGHVFLRSRTVKPAANQEGGRRSLPNQAGPPGPGNLKSFKFRRVPWLQRVVKVCANSTGAFGAIAVDAVPEPVPTVPKSLGDELAQGFPHLRNVSASDANGVRAESAEGSTEGSGDDEVSSPAVPDEDEEDTILESAELKSASQLCAALISLEEAKLSQITHPEQAPARQLWGADISVDVAGCTIYAHRAVLSARSGVLRNVLAGQAHNGQEVALSLVKNSKQASMTRLNLRLLTRPNTVLQELHDLPLAFHPLSVLLLLQYLYSDQIPTIWDPRVGETLLARFPKLKLHFSRLKAEVLTLSRALDLAALETFMTTLSYARVSPPATLSRDMNRLFEDSQNKRSMPYDMVIQLADCEVYCHSIILRTRSPFFASMFDDEEWMAARWSSEHIVRINLYHLPWSIMEVVFKYIYEDAGVELFDPIVKDTLDEFLDFIFQVMHAANEFLLEKLMLICSSVILRHVNLYNVPSLLADAAHLTAKPLMDSLCGYIAVNLESIMESRMLDDVSFDLVEKVAAFIRQAQLEQSLVSRSGILIAEAMKLYGDWLATEDFPQPILRSWKKMIKQSPRLSPVNPTSPRISPMIRPVISPIIPAPPKRHLNVPEEGVFAMDDDGFEISNIPQLSLDGGSAPSSPAIPNASKGPAWKGKTVQAQQRTDMRSIMAEEAKTVRHQTPALGMSSISLSPSPRPGASAQPSRPSSGAPPVQRTPSGGPAPPGVLTPTMPGTPVLQPAGRPSVQRAGQSTPSAQSSRPARPGPASTPDVRQPSFKGLGPVITPVRAAPAEGSSRRRNQDAWASFAPPPPPPASSPPAAGGMSFLEIQQQQRAELTAGSRGPKKPSLLEIQEQERLRREEERATREEVEFMTWWQQEEERMRREEAGPAHVSGGGDAGRGRGRGGGRSRGTEGARGGRGARKGGGHPARDRRIPQNTPPTAT